MDHQEKGFFEDEDRNWLEDWNRRQHMGVAQFPCYAAYAIYLSRWYDRRDFSDKSATSSKGRKRKASEDAECKRVFKSIIKALSRVTEAVREGNDITERSQAEIYSAEEVFTELKNIGLRRIHSTGPTDILLMADAVKVRACSGFLSEERKNILLQLMRASPGFKRSSFHG